MKILLFANTDWYLYNYRLPLAKALRERGDEVVLISPPGRYSRLLEQAGFRWLSFPLERKSMNPAKELASVFRISRLLKREKPDLAHFFTIKPVLYGSLAARLGGYIRVVNSITGLGYIFSDAGTLLRPFIKLIYRLSLAGTNVIFQNTDDLAYFINNKLIKKEQAFLIPGSGVDLTAFSPSSEPAGSPLVMLAGRLLRSKGIPEFVQAASKIKAEGVHARFAIVGEPYPDNPDSVKPEELAAWQKQELVELWGWHDDMAQVVSSSAIICLPTQYKEGLPRLLLEAGACERPVIASDIPGCRMVVRHGENGLLVPPGNVQALVAALKTLILDPEMRHKMGKRGREIVESEFSVDRVIFQTIRVYNHFD